MLEHADQRVLDEIGDVRVAARARHPPDERVHHRVIALDELLERCTLALLRPAQRELVQLGATGRFGANGCDGSSHIYVAHASVPVGSMENTSE
ncbi:MAG TPA: hypothetical protein VGL61_04005 [Kofleriaceae bacterium]